MTPCSFPEPLIPTELSLWVQGDDLQIPLGRAPFTLKQPLLVYPSRHPSTQGQNENEWVTNPTEVTAETLEPSGLQLEFSQDTGTNAAFIPSLATF